MTLRNLRKATGFLETFVNIYQKTRRNVSEESSLKTLTYFETYAYTIELISEICVLVI
jgi:hypothetical protein